MGSPAAVLNRVFGVDGAVFGLLTEQLIMWRLRHARADENLLQAAAAAVI
jgi:hypothetical protein